MGITGSVEENGRKSDQNAEFQEERLAREEIFRGKIFSVHRDRVRLPDGSESIREVVEHGGGVAVLALDDENNLYTVTQYRYVFGRDLTELPAGKLDPGEDPRAAGLRELREETGIVPEKFEFLGKILPSPGCYTEILYLYLARGLRVERQRLDPGEFLRVEKIPFDEMFRRCMAGEIEDAKTVVAIFKAKLSLDL